MYGGVLLVRKRHRIARNNQDSDLDSNHNCPDLHIALFYSRAYLDCICRRGVHVLALLLALRPSRDRCRVSHRFAGAVRKRPFLTGGLRGGGLQKGSTREHQWAFACDEPTSASVRLAREVCRG